MDFLPYTQEYMLMVSVMAGMLLGFLWDTYRLVRHFARTGTFGTAVGDLIYWIISINVSVRIIFNLSYGNVRLFILIGFIMGALLYFYGISRYVLKFLIFVTGFVLGAIKKIFWMLVEPFRFVIKQLRLLLHPIVVKLEKMRNNAKKRWKFYKFKLKKISKNRKLMYNKRKLNKRMTKGRKERKPIERGSKDYRAEEKNKQRRLQKKGNGNQGT
ncbi:MAG: spore cortex biosynthesis protein YabQ [Sedimentibacter sp.]|uniref:spore cortex biosynthesis protein YabQ n=1 Tax=Sedimentibacter sp. TaxID=1960295 RepID=UPI0031580761